MENPAPHGGASPAFQLGGRLDITDPIPEVDDPERFHEGWEAHIFGLWRTVTLNGLFTTDEFRHAIERLPPESYTGMPYFERWIHAIQRLCVEKGHLSQDDLTAGYATAVGRAHAHPTPEPVPLAAHHPAGLEPPPTRQRFGPGARVRLHDGPGDHHRMPVWARDRIGVITAVRGHFPLPDLIVDRGGNAEAPDRYALYSVEIRATDAFPDAHPGDALALDAYDPYLEEAH